MQRLNQWLSALLQERGADLFRSKGILSIAGSDDRHVFQGVHMLLQFTSSAEGVGRPWAAGAFGGGARLCAGRGRGLRRAPRMGVGVGAKRLCCVKLGRAGGRGPIPASPLDWLCSLVDSLTPCHAKPFPSRPPSLQTTAQTRSASTASCSSARTSTARS